MLKLKVKNVPSLQNSKGRAFQAEEMTSAKILGLFLVNFMLHKFISLWNLIFNLFFDNPTVIIILLPVYNTNL